MNICWMNHWLDLHGGKIVLTVIKIYALEAEENEVRETSSEVI